ncbi:MAG: hypothetical protein ABSD10_03280 [Candidatus Saccharimonadales bacterium]|jgi:hypothetical protein
MKSKDDTNLYKPDDSDDTSTTTGAKGSTITWTASEYVEHQHGVGWYASLVVVTVALTAGIYFITKDYFAAGTIITLGIIVAVFAGHQPSQIEFELSDSGLRVGEKNYSYSLFKSFSIFREGKLPSINMAPIKRFMPPISAYFDPKDERKIVDLLGEHIPFEPRNPSVIDRLSQRLRL